MRTRFNAIYLGPHTKIHESELRRLVGQTPTVNLPNGQAVRGRITGAIQNGEWIELEIEHDEYIRPNYQIASQRAASRWNRRQE